MKIYISKFALSDGILGKEAGKIEEGRASQVDGYLSFYTFKMGVDAHLNKEDAINAANVMKEKRIAALQRQLKRLEKLTFVVKEG